MDEVYGYVGWKKMKVAMRFGLHTRGKRKEVMNCIDECDVVIIFSGYEIWGPVGMEGVDIIGEMGSGMW